MDEKIFLRILAKLKLITGEDLSVIGMAGKYKGSKIAIEGDIDNAFAIRITEFNYTGDDCRATTIQSLKLQEKLNLEIESLYGESWKIAQMNQEAEDDLMKYGQEGALYGKFY